MTRSRSSPRGRIPSGRRRSRGRSRSAERNVSNTSSSDSSTTIARSSASETMNPSSSSLRRGLTRVEHGPHQRHPEVQLQVLGLVPEQRRNPVARLDPEVAQPRGEAACALSTLADRGPVDRAVGPPRDDLPPGRQLLRAVYDRGQRQREVVHHQALGHLLGHALLRIRLSLILGPTGYGQGRGDGTCTTIQEFGPISRGRAGAIPIRQWSCPMRFARCWQAGWASGRRPGPRGRSRR